MSALASAEPLKVNIGMHGVQLRAVDSRTERFCADLSLWLRFPIGNDDLGKELIERLATSFSLTSSSSRASDERPPARDVVVG